MICLVSAGGTWSRHYDVRVRINVRLDVYSSQQFRVLHACESFTNRSCFIAYFVKWGLLQRTSFLNAFVWRLLLRSRGLFPSKRSQRFFIYANSRTPVTRGTAGYYTIQMQDFHLPTFLDSILFRIQAFFFFPLYKSDFPSSDAIFSFFSWGLYMKWGFPSIVQTFCGSAFSPNNSGFFSLYFRQFIIVFPWTVNGTR